MASFVSRSTCSRIEARNSRLVGSSSSSSVEQLQEAAEREERRAQLVRRVRDEFAPRVVELREADAHALERVGELAQLAAARSTTGSSKRPLAIRSAARSSRRIRRANIHAPP